MSTEVQEEVVNNPVDEFGHLSAWIGETDELVKRNKSGVTSMEKLKQECFNKKKRQEYVGDKNKGILLKDTVVEKVLKDTGELVINSDTEAIATKTLGTESEIIKLFDDTVGEVVKQLVKLMTMNHNKVL